MDQEIRKKAFFCIIFIDILPCIDYPQSSRLHAVYRPVGDSIIIANRYGEPAKVGPDQVDDRPLLTLDVQGGTFAAVFSAPLITYKKKKSNSI